MDPVSSSGSGSRTSTGSSDPKRAPTQKLPIRLGRGGLGGSLGSHLNRILSLQGESSRSFLLLAHLRIHRITSRKVRSNDNVGSVVFVIVEDIAGGGTSHAPKEIRSDCFLVLSGR